MELTVVIPTVKPRPDVEALDYLEQCRFEDYELILREDVPVTRARNEGYKRANTDKIVYLDDDSRPRDGYLRAAASTLDSEAAVAGRTVHPRDDLFAGQLTSHYSWGDKPCYVDRFWGCNMGIRREVLDDVGGWDERMGWGQEEKELAERLLERYDIYYDPEMVVDHVYAESLVDYWNKQYRLHRQTPYYLHKRGESMTQILRSTVRKLFDPWGYLRSSPTLTIAESGATLAGVAGRAVGMIKGPIPVTGGETGSGYQDASE